MRARVQQLSSALPRPLDFARYIKLKLGLVILASGLAERPKLERDLRGLSLDVAKEIDHQHARHVVGHGN